MMMIYIMNYYAGFAVVVRRLGFLQSFENLLLGEILMSSIDSQ